MDTREGQDLAITKARFKSYIDEMNKDELGKLDIFMADLRQKDCSQSALIDGLDCRQWAYYFMMTKEGPSTKQGKALQQCGFLTAKVKPGGYGWHCDTDWAEIAAAVLAAN